MRTRIIGVAATAALALGAVAVPAVTADGGAKTKIEIKRLTASKIKGTISSEKRFCKRKRHVQIFRLEGYLSHKVVRGDAQRDGDWKFRMPLQPGQYFAKVDSKPGCRYDVSGKKTLR